MTFIPFSRALPVTLAVVLSLASAALTQHAAAQSAPAPAAEPAKAAEPAAKPAEEEKCVTSEEGFKTLGTRGAFMVSMTNTCEKRMRCVIDVYVTAANGPTKGHGVVTLGKKSEGAAAKKAYMLKLKLSFGSANVARSCKEI